MTTPAKPVPAKPATAQAPAVHTDPRTNERAFYKQRMEEIEAKAKELQVKESQERIAGLAQLRAQLRELRDREAREVGGGNIRTPRGNLINADAAIEKRPEFHYRFVDTTPGKGKAENAQALGYERVPEEEGGKALGGLVLFRTPLEKFAARQAAYDKETSDRLRRAQDEWNAEVREMAKFLRRKGVDITPDQLGISEREEED